MYRRHLSMYQSCLKSANRWRWTLSRGSQHASASLTNYREQYGPGNSTWSPEKYSCRSRSITEVEYKSYYLHSNRKSVTSIRRMGKLIRNWLEKFTKSGHSPGTYDVNLSSAVLLPVVHWGSFFTIIYAVISKLYLTYSGHNLLDKE